MKRLIGIILSIITVISCTIPISVEAKVIEPEIVKTESWTTSYYIDDDMDTLYPYIQCEADIYNDGTIKLYMWNTHEWDGFATVKHDIIFYHSNPVSVTSPEAQLILFNSVQDSYTVYKIIEDAVMQEKLKEVISYYPHTYEMKSGTNAYPDFGASFRSSLTSIPTLSERIKSNSVDGTWSSFNEPFSLSHNRISNLALPELRVSTKRSQCYYIFQPTSNTNFSADQLFRIYGHDITITPELLSGNIVAEPELTDQEKYIKQLEEENARLKASITNTNLFGDVNKDNLVDVADAQMILNYYVYTLANSDAEPLEEWISKQ